MCVVLLLSVGVVDGVYSDCQCLQFIVGGRREDGCSRQVVPSQLSLRVRLEFQQRASQETRVRDGAGAPTMPPAGLQWREPPADTGAGATGEERGEDQGGLGRQQQAGPVTIAVPQRREDVEEAPVPAAALDAQELPAASLPAADSASTTPCPPPSHHPEGAAPVGHEEAETDQPSTGTGGEGVEQVANALPAPTLGKLVRQPTGNTGWLQPTTVAGHVTPGATAGTPPKEARTNCSPQAQEAANNRASIFNEPSAAVGQGQQGDRRVATMSPSTPSCRPPGMESSRRAHHRLRHASTQRRTESLSTLQEAPRRTPPKHPARRTTSATMPPWGRQPPATLPQRMITTRASSVRRQ